MAREKAREEVESEAWVKERARLENLANSSRLTHHAVALDPDATVPERDQRCVRVGVVGVPNAGKSQLVNTLVGSQICAVSAKTNTTRVETLGALTRGDAQAVLLDLPGVVGPEHYRNPTHATKVSSAWAAAAGCDLLLFIVDANRQARRPDPRVVDLLASARANLERLKYTEVTGLSMPPAVLALMTLPTIPARPDFFWTPVSAPVVMLYFEPHTPHTMLCVSSSNSEFSRGNLHFLQLDERQ